MSRSKNRNKRYVLSYTCPSFYNGYYMFKYKHDDITGLEIYSCTYSRACLVEKFMKLYLHDNTVFDRIYNDLSDIKFTYKKISSKGKYTEYKVLNLYYYKIEVYNSKGELEVININNFKHEVFNTLIRKKKYPKSNSYGSILVNGKWKWIKNKKYSIKKHSKYDSWDKHAEKHFDIKKV